MTCCYNLNLSYILSYNCQYYYYCDDDDFDFDCGYSYCYCYCGYGDSNGYYCCYDGDDVHCCGC